MKIILVFFISLAFCSDDEKYTLIFGDFDVGEKMIYKYSLETFFTVPGIGLIKYMEEYIETLEFLGVEEDFWKFKATLTEMKSDNYVNGIEIMNYYRDALENNPCYLYVKNRGFDDDVDRIEPIKEEDAYLQEAYEGAYMNILRKPFRYPFGSKAVDVAVGDRWIYDEFSSKIYVNIGSPPSLLTSGERIFTLKKVKEKGDRKIASIELQEDEEIEMPLTVDFLGERRLMVGHVTGNLDMTYRWDIDSGEMLKVYAIANLAGDFEMDGKKFYMKIFMRNISKKVQ